MPSARTCRGVPMTSVARELCARCRPLKMRRAANHHRYYTMVYSAVPSPLTPPNIQPAPRPQAPVSQQVVSVSAQQPTYTQQGPPSWPVQPSGFSYSGSYPGGMAPPPMQPSLVHPAYGVCMFCHRFIEWILKKRNTSIPLGSLPVYETAANVSTSTTTSFTPWGIA